MERRLGRGLGSLLGQTTEGTQPQAGDGPTESPARGAPAASVSTPASPTVTPVGQMIEVSAIRRNPEQPRKTFDSASLEELRQSIERHGVLQPICVRRAGKGFEIVSGERRWRASRSAGLKTIPATIREDVNDDVSLELAIVENVQREDLDALEKARGYKALMDRIGLTQEGVAERVGVNRSTVANQIRLLDLPEDAQAALTEGLISMGHARALLGLKGSKAILGALGQVVRKDLSVRDTEQLVKAGASSSPSGSSDDGTDGGALKTKDLQPAAPWVKELEGRIRGTLGVKVALKNGKGYRGSITLDYSSREELERLVEQIAPKATL